MAIAPLDFDPGTFVGDIRPVTAGDLAAYQTTINGIMMLDFPDGADEYAAVTPYRRMTNYGGGTLTAYIAYISTATANEHVIEVYVEAITDGDTTDLDTSTSFDAANSATVTVPGTAGHIDVAAITLTNKDSVAANDWTRFLLRRNSADVGDDAAGTLRVLGMQVVET